MMNLTREQIEDLATITVSWARDVSDMWVGTPYEEYINSRSEEITKTVKNKSLDASRDMLFDFAQFLEQAEKEYEG